MSLKKRSREEFGVSFLFYFPSITFSNPLSSRCLDTLLLLYVDPTCGISAFLFILAPLFSPLSLVAFTGKLLTCIGSTFLFSFTFPSNKTPRHFCILLYPSTVSTVSKKTTSHFFTPYTTVEIYVNSRGSILQNIKISLSRYVPHPFLFHSSCSLFKFVSTFVCIYFTHTFFLFFFSFPINLFCYSTVLSPPPPPFSL
jgi:hypothetical protein